jgi:glycosyltransferase involved in cell wall biosynthesis
VISSYDGERKLRVLIIEPSGLLGGSELALLDLLRHLPPNKLQAAVAFPAGAPVRHKLASCDVGLIEGPIGMLHRRGRIARVRAAAWLAATIRREKPDIVHVNQAGFARLVAAASKLSNVPVVVHVRMQEDARKLRANRNKPLQPAAWVAISRAVLDELSPDNRAELIHDPFAIDEFAQMSGVESVAATRGSLGLPLDRRIVLHVGRICAQKGQDVLLRAAIECRNMGWHYLFVGATPPGDDEASQYCRSLEESIASNLDGSAHLLGERHDIARLMHASDVVVMSSHGESFGRVLLESLSLGVPVIGPAEAGPAEIIGAEERGYLFAPGNSQSLAEALRRCFEDYPEAMNRGQEGRRWVAATCDPHLHAERISDLWDRTARSTGNRAP